MDSTNIKPAAIELKQFQQDLQRERGKLKIFFGYAPGVGKTYSMLEAAHTAKETGIDVVVGYIEPHTRPNTLALLEGLEQLPPAHVKYKGVELREFDIDSALKRRPDVLLVDELAHTNAQGSRHLKRFQDVEELLTAGIDVYTTVNVQHIESINDVIESITGVVVRERIPDKIFDGAHRVELIDIEPADLIERLGRGDVYQEFQAQQALINFFTPENLIALRELALRLAANRINITASAMVRKEPADSPYIAGEHVLLCLSPSPSNAKVVRTAARMAEAFHCPLTALYVETSDFIDMIKEDNDRFMANLRLAEQLGANVVTVYGDNVAQLISDYAKISNISKIVIGRPARPFRYLAGPNLIDKLSSLAPDTEIFVIPNKATSNSPKRPIKLRAPRFSVIDTVKAVSILVLTTLVGFLFRYLHFDESNIITVYILGVLITAAVTQGMIYSSVSSVLSVMSFNFFFTEPRFTFYTYNPGYPLTFFIMFLAAILSSTLATRLQSQAQMSSMQAHRMEILLETSQKLQLAKSRGEIFEKTAQQIVKLLDRTVVLYPIENGNLGEPLIIDTGHHPKKEFLAPNERSVAEWVFKNNRRAGASTNTLSGAKCLYMAIRSGDTVFAVVGFSMIRHPKIDAFEQNLLIAILAECALAVEKYKSE